MSSQRGRFLPQFGTPIHVGRGRGMPTPIPFSFDSPAPGDRMPLLEAVPIPQASSTQSLTGDNSGCVGDQMRSVIQEIGHQLADSIMSRIQPPNTVTPSPTTARNMVNTFNQPSHVSDVSQVQVVTQRKVKEPPSFVGDGSDLITVCEWEDLMRTFIKKSNVRVEEQADEILMHLRGKAKDVVRFGIRNGSVDVSAHPDAIYGILRKHFSSTRYSTVPLADFYSTLPKDQEDPYDYWLRLNRAADFAADCLKEQGKTLDDPDMEVTRMFIRNCPSRDLALTFRSKTIDRWSACEVLEVLNEYHAEMNYRANAQVHPVKKVDVPVHKAEVTHCPAPAHECHEPHQTQSPQCVPLAEVMTMLEKVLLRGASDQPQVRRRTPPKQPASRIDGFTDRPCIICKDDDHSAFIHCREKRLCFQCHAPGHSRRDCPEREAATEHQGN